MTFFAGWGFIGGSNHPTRVALSNIAIGVESFMSKMKLPKWIYQEAKKRAIAAGFRDNKNIDKVSRKLTRIAFYDAFELIESYEGKIIFPREKPDE